MNGFMSYYPIFLDVQGKSCLVVGGGKVGARKAFGLAGAGAQVRVVSLGFTPELEAASGGDICLDKKEFDLSDLEGAGLVFAATDSVELNAWVRDAARERNILCNIADGRDKGDFILPSTVKQGDLMIAISTCGASPALARKLRRQLSAEFGLEYGVMLTLMANVRKEMLARGHDPDGHKEIFTALVDSDLPALIAAGDKNGVNGVLKQVLGDEFTFDELTARSG
ncbi:MAG: bifunctional precorrin-2 dehydrogenase/sirohydrochlorin ferrochelatase [Desulfobacterales bacterium]|nr:bifunctional precorrin-2 dehydrogenase/sirohydrochlorin ferrochelatase [Desulfobacterales bacterium]